ncbi:ATP-binding cassette transporter, putative [Talaromyces marneffei ATCC 18224]|uniref:ATP-binding cassette transporter, putative n=1 Tax=Talaromyces marneffei (strain ATCC 18224 / CBS 334.59 / QM 7333) TaxID=441960 RepID=B6QCZ8_TALMQ|nr:ATP-binding cassette transporter, putative [Talaromyces marneffei ATCC 18224]
MITNEKNSEVEKASAQTQNQKEASQTHQSLYAALLHIQLWVVLQRTWLYWREPDYMVSKLWMNIGYTLVNGLTYLQSSNSQLGVYHRVFSDFMALIVGPPLGLQVQPRFVTLREIFMHRERYSFLMYELFAVFETSLAQLCASLMPNIEAAFAANGFFFMFCNTLAGTRSPKSVTPSGWRWYYNVSPLYYWSEGVVTNALHDLPIRCQEPELSIFDPPNGTTCGQYAANFLQTATGYLVNPDDGSDCQYCSYRDGQSYVSGIDKKK